MAQLKRVYLAGFDVFRQDAVEYGNKLKELCKQYGFIGLFPLDNEIDFTGFSKNAMALGVFNANISLIMSSDIIAANLNPFRGSEPDSGTAFECGFGLASHKKLYGYISDARSMVAKAANDTLDLSVDGRWVDTSTKMYIEDFALPLNLMLSCSMNIIEGDFEACIKKISQDLVLMP